MTDEVKLNRINHIIILHCFSFLLLIINNNKKKMEYFEINIFFMSTYIIFS